MKRFVLFMFLVSFVMFGSQVLAAPPLKIVWHDGLVHTVGWNPVLDYDDGTPITGVVVNYHVFVRSPSDPSPLAAKEVGTTQDPVVEIQLNPGDKYLVGVAAEAPGISTSDTSWSDIQEDCQGGIIFGIQYIKGVSKKPGRPTGVYVY